MTIRNPAYTVYTAGGTVRPNRLVKIGAADQTVVECTAATDIPIGVAVQNITAAQGDRVDICTGGQYEVKAGGVIARGGPVCSDANGLGVAAAPATGVNNGIVGYADETSANGDVITVSIRPQRIQG